MNHGRGNDDMYGRDAESQKKSQESERDHTHAHAPDIMQMTKCDFKAICVIN